MHMTYIIQVYNFMTWFMYNLIYGHVTRFVCNVIVKFLRNVMIFFEG
jgi:hypothetical protein